MTLNELEHVAGAMELVGLSQESEALSVYRAFEQVQDGRHKRGVRYSVALILTLIVLGKLARMTTPAAIAEWVRLRAEWLSQVLPGMRTGEASTSSSPRAISPPCMTTCVCFSASLLLTARIDAQHAPATKAMGGWKSGR